MLLCIALVAQVPWYLVRCRRILVALLAGQRGRGESCRGHISLPDLARAHLDCAFIKWPPSSLSWAVISVSITSSVITSGCAVRGGEKTGPQKEPAHIKIAYGDAQRADTGKLEPSFHSLKTVTSHWPRS